MWINKSTGWRKAVCKVKVSPTAPSIRKQRSWIIHPTVCGELESYLLPLSLMKGRLGTQRGCSEDRQGGQKEYPFLLRERKAGWDQRCIFCGMALPFPPWRTSRSQCNPLGSGLSLLLPILGISPGDQLNKGQVFKQTKSLIEEPTQKEKARPPDWTSH